MSNDNQKNPKEGVGVRSPFVAPAEVIKQHVYTRFARFMAVPDPDKCEMLGIPIDEKTGKMLRRPTLKEFAKHEGVSDDTLTLWKKKKEFQTAVAAYRREWGTELTSNIMGALYRNCIMRGNAYDVELWLAYMENWDRKQVIKVVQEKFDADDLRAIIARLPKEEQDKWYVTIGELISISELHGGKSSHGSGREVPQNSAQRSGENQG